MNIEEQGADRPVLRACGKTVETVGRRLPDTNTLLKPNPCSLLTEENEGNEGRKRTVALDLSFFPPHQIVTRCRGNKPLGLSETFVNFVAFSSNSTAWNGQTFDFIFVAHHTLLKHSS